MIFEEKTDENLSSCEEHARRKDYRHINDVTELILRTVNTAGKFTSNRGLIGKRLLPPSLPPFNRFSNCHLR